MSRQMNRLSKGFETFITFKFSYFSWIADLWFSDHWNIQMIFGNSRIEIFLLLHEPFLHVDFDLMCKKKFWGIQCTEHCASFYLLLFQLLPGACISDSRILNVRDFYRFFTDFFHNDKLHEWYEKCEVDIETMIEIKSITVFSLLI